MVVWDRERIDVMEFITAFDATTQKRRIFQLLSTIVSADSVLRAKLQRILYFSSRTPMELWVWFLQRNCLWGRAKAATMAMYENDIFENECYQNMKIGIHQHGAILHWMGEKRIFRAHEGQSITSEKITGYVIGPRRRVTLQCKGGKKITYHGEEVYSIQARDSTNLQRLSTFMLCFHRAHGSINLSGIVKDHIAPFLGSCIRYNYGPIMQDILLATQESP